METGCAWPVILISTICQEASGSGSCEVHRKTRALAPGGGYFAWSSNTVTEYVEPEDSVAMLEAIQDFGECLIRIGAAI
ncbi:MAG: hypothetical protein MUQ10_19705 [Anaerolineae bacterium]|nr:hypothetical protein [Anaerolineae bacterium]